MRTFLCVAVIWFSNWLELFTSADVVQPDFDICIQFLGMFLCVFQDIRWLFKK